jgi:hypothetical protein
VVQATQPLSSGTSGGSMRVNEDASVVSGGGEAKRSSMGMSFTPTQNSVRSRLGSFTRRSETLGGIVARTLVLYTV